MEILLYQLLKNNKELIDLIGENNIYPVYATNLKKAAIEYEFTPLKSGVINQSRFSINIISKDYDLIIQIKSILNKILIEKFENQFIVKDNYKFNIALSGGSTPLYRDDLKIYQVNLNYLVKWIEI